MSRRRHQGDEPTLFDLPLDPPGTTRPDPEETETPDRSRQEPAVPVRGPDRPAQEPSERVERSAPPPAPSASPEPVAQPATLPATLSVRFLAGLADLAIHLALAVALLFGSRLLGAAAGFEDWFPLAVFLMVFSFFYAVLPLAFWGQTAGMAWAGVEARAIDGASLTFPQTAFRWSGGLLSVLLLGLPTLLALGGSRRSLADRLSDSDCYLTD